LYLAWTIPVGILFVSVSIIFAVLLFQFKKQNPEIEELRKQFYYGVPKPKPENNDSNHPPQVQLRNLAMAQPYSRKKWEIKRKMWDTGQFSNL